MLRNSIGKIIRLLRAPDRVEVIRRLPDGDRWQFFVCRRDGSRGYSVVLKVSQMPKELARRVQGLEGSEGR